MSVCASVNKCLSERENERQREQQRDGIHVLGKIQMQTVSKKSKFFTRTGSGKTTGQGQAEVRNPEQKTFCL